MGQDTVGARDSGRDIATRGVEVDVEVDVDVDVGCGMWMQEI
jgi:hypothetical protein